MKTILTIIGSLAVLFAGVSCMEMDDAAIEATTQEIGGPGFPGPGPAWPTFPHTCPHCGKNSPVVDGVTFYELALDQETRNSQDMRLGNVRDHNGKSAQLEVRGDTLYRRNYDLGGIAPPWQNSMALSKFKLTKLGVGSILYVYQWDKEQEKEIEYELEIMHIGETNHWVDENARPATTYRMEYTVPGPENRTVDLCPEDTLNGSTTDLNGPKPHHFVVFAGDRMDPETMTVASGEDAEGWLNFACEGSAPYKMHMNRYTAAGATQSFETEPEQRQAMLKMFAADYCGDGTVHTVNGRPLEYEDYDDELEATSPAASLEAFWDENGATCLATPRYAQLDEISCSQDLQDGHDCISYALLGNPWDLVSANPAPPE